MLIHVYTHGNICLHASLSVLSALLLNSTKDTFTFTP